MGKTHVQMRTALRDWLDLDTTRLPDSIATDILNLNQRELCRLNDLSFNEISDTFVTIASTRNYAKPATWSRPHTLWYLHPTNGSIVFLSQLSKEKFDLNFPDSTKTALPTAYTTWGTNIQLGKTPDQIVTINRNFYGLLADLSADGDTNGLTNDAWEVLLFKCLSDVSAYGIEDPRIPLWRSRYNEVLNALVIEQAAAQSSGRKAQSEEPG